MKKNLRLNQLAVLNLLCLVGAVGCSSEAMKNHAKEAAARYWQDKAYPGKGFDIQVIEAEKTDGGYRVKGIVDGETRVGVFSPDSETFSEGYYSLAHERDKKIAELEQELKYHKDRADDLEKENYKLKVKMEMGGKGRGSDDDSSAAEKKPAVKESATSKEVTKESSKETSKENSKDSSSDSIKDGAKDSDK